MAVIDEEVPVLNDVIRSGDKSLIRSNRFNLSDGNLADSELADTPQFELPAHLQWEVLGIKSSSGNSQCESSVELEDQIDQIIDKHIVALRKELRILLDQA
jgi:hypothetical protein